MHKSLSNEQDSRLRVQFHLGAERLVVANLDVRFG